MVQALIPSPTAVSSTISWEKLPDDFLLPDDPVDNINQPTLAAALTDSLFNAGKLSENSLTTTNYGICARLDGKFVVKAPDWSYIAQITVSRNEVERSYTPQLQGDTPAIAMEFLSDTDGAEYSSKPTYPPGKWFFYEKILKIPYYVIFDLESARLEVYQLGNSGEYQLQFPEASGRYWIEVLDLYLGVWEGDRENHHQSWLRWWTKEGELLLWGTELAQREKQRADSEYQRAESEHQRAESEHQRAERLAAILKAQGIDPDTIS